MKNEHTYHAYYLRDEQRNRESDIYTNSRSRKLYTCPHYTDSRFKHGLVVFGNKEDPRIKSWDYDDRIREWDYEKHKQAWETARKKYDVSCADFYELYLSEYFGKKSEPLFCCCWVQFIYRLSILCFWLCV